MNTRKYHILFHCMAALMLVFSGLHLFAAPRTVRADVVAAGPQMQSRPAPGNRGGGIPFLTTRLAAPLAAPTPDTANTDEDTPIDINVLSNDTGGPYTINSLDTTGTLGAVSINTDQTIHYDPTVGLNDLSAGQVYNDTFQYTVISGTIPVNTQVTVAVTGVNDQPVAVDDPSASTNENTAADFDVLANDSDPDTNDTLTVQSVDTSGTQGSVTINSGGASVHYNPGTAFDYLAAGATATDTFQYTVSDGHTGTATATVTVTINGVNDNPTPVGDSAATSENTTLNINASTLLSNDTDPDGDPLSITGVITSATQGSATWNNSSQNVRYNPGTAFDYLAVGATATDTFQYTVSDGQGGSANATVTVTITGVNDNPTPQDDNAATDQNTAIDIPASTLLSNDTDPDGDPLSITGVITTGTQGSASWNATSQNVHYDPGTAFDSLAVGATATDTFQYTVSDGQGGSANATVTVTITGLNDNPIAVDDTKSTGENTATNIDVLSNDSDPDISDTLTVQSVDNSSAQGTATVVSGGTSVDYDPGTAFDYLAAGVSGTDTFQYTVSDGHTGTATATVTVTINGVNDNPTPVGDSAATSENTAINIAASTLLSNDSDPEGDPLSITGVVTTAATQGSASWNASSQNVRYNPGTAFDYLGAGATATDTFQYTVSDGQGGSANATVTVTITGVNDNPTPVGDSATTGENMAIDISASTLLSNDSDPEGDSLSITGVVASGTQGSVSWNASSQNVHYDPGTIFNYLGRNQTTTDTFGYTVSDGQGGTGTATVTVTLIGANDPPVAVEDTYTTPANTLLNVSTQNGVLSNDSDPDSGDSLTTVLVTNPSHGVLLQIMPSGGFVYTPTLNYHGLDQFTYHASDGLASSNDVTVTIGVNVTNQPPVVVADTKTTAEDTPVAIPVTSNDYDPDGSLNLNRLSVTIQPAHGTTQVNTSTGAITYRPSSNFNGTDTFQYQIYDQDAVLPRSGTAPVTVTVTPVNDPPQATDLSLKTPEDTPSDISLATSVSDVENDINKNSLQVTTPPGHGTAVVKPNLIITYSPAPNYNGSDQFDYRICDSGSLCAQASINIDVTPVNDPPVAANDHYYTKPISITVNAPGVLANDSDVDAGDHLKASLVIEPANGTLKLNEDGSFTYTPNENVSYLNDRFSYQVRDSKNALSNTAWVTITVDASPPDVNWQSPMGNGGIYYANSGQQIPLVISATDNIPIARVEFFRWDPNQGNKGDYVDIANLTKAPFRALIHVNDLNVGWNQIFARVYDAAGNINTVVDPDHPGFIWIIRREKIYLPLLAMSKSP